MYTVGIVVYDTADDNDDDDVVFAAAAYDYNGDDTEDAADYAVDSDADNGNDSDDDNDDAAAVDEDEEEEDDAGDDDASQAPAFLAGCGHWTNIHFEMGLPTTPIHSVYFLLCTMYDALHCTLYFVTENANPLCTL